MKNNQNDNFVNIELTIDEMSKISKMRKKEKEKQNKKETKFKTLLDDLVSIYNASNSKYVNKTLRQKRYINYNLLEDYLRIFKSFSDNEFKLINEKIGENILLYKSNIDQYNTPYLLDFLQSMKLSLVSFEEFHNSIKISEDSRYETPHKIDYEYIYSELYSDIYKFFNQRGSLIFDLNYFVDNNIICNAHEGIEYATCDSLYGIPYSLICKLDELNYNLIIKDGQLGILLDEIEILNTTNNVSKIKIKSGPYKDNIIKGAIVNNGKLSDLSEINVDINFLINYNL